MLRRTLLVATSAALLLTACKDDTRPAAGPAATTAAPPPTTPAPAPAADGTDCKVMTAAIVEEVLGKKVATSKNANPQSCADYKAEDGTMVTVHTETGGFDSFVGAAPRDMYTVRKDDVGLGDRSVLFQTQDREDAIPYLIVQKGDTVVVMGAFGATRTQVLELGKRAVARL